MKHSITFVTAPTARVAETIARDLVDTRLAACVNIVPRATSIYAWKGKVRRDAEVVMLIKSRADRHGALERRIRELHPYDLPEIVHVPVAGGSRPYLDWIDGAVGGKRRRTGGFARYDHMIPIALIAMGAAIGIPALVRLLRHEGPPNSAWGGLIVGGLLFLAGAGLVVWWALAAWLERRKNR